MPDLSQRPELAALASTDDASPWPARALIVGSLLTLILLAHGVTAHTMSDEAPYDDRALLAALGDPGEVAANQAQLLVELLEGPDWRRLSEAQRADLQDIGNVDELPAPRWVEPQAVASLMAALPRDLALADRALEARRLDFGALHIHQLWRSDARRGMLRLLCLQRLRTRAALDAGRLDQAAQQTLALLRVLRSAETDVSSTRQLDWAWRTKRAVFEELLAIVDRGPISAEVLRAGLASFAPTGHQRRALSALRASYLTGCESIELVIDQPGQLGNRLEVTSYNCRPNMTRRLLGEAALRAAQAIRSGRTEALVASIVWTDRESLTPNAVGRHLVELAGFDGLEFHRGWQVAQAIDHGGRALLLLMLRERAAGALPATLAELGAEADGLRDPFDGEAIRYDAGRRLLWVVGNDRVDQGAVQGAPGPGRRWGAVDPCLPIPAPGAEQD